MFASLGDPFEQLRGQSKRAPSGVQSKRAPSGFSRDSSAGSEALSFIISGDIFPAVVSLSHDSF